jgi:hypothetical protein
METSKDEFANKCISYSRSINQGMRERRIDPFSLISMVEVKQRTAKQIVGLGSFANNTSLRASKDTCLSNSAQKEKLVES